MRGGHLGLVVRRVPAYRPLPAPGTWAKTTMHPVAWKPNGVQAVGLALAATTANMRLFSAAAAGFVAPTAGTYWSTLLPRASITPRELGPGGVVLKFAPVT